MNKKRHPNTMVRMIRTICTADPDPESGLLSSDGVKVLCDVVEDASGDDDVAVVGESVAFVTFTAAVDGVAVVVVVTLVVSVFLVVSVSLDVDVVVVVSPSGALVVVVVAAVVVVSFVSFSVTVEVDFVVVVVVSSGAAVVVVSFSLETVVVVSVVASV